MPKADIFSLANAWRKERADFLQRAERAKAVHFEVYPEDHPDREPTGEWLFWNDRAAELGLRIHEFEAALTETVPNRYEGLTETISGGQMSEERRQELSTILDEMRETVDRFYFRAIGIHNHPFIEWTGVLNEYIKMCWQALEAGVDFTRCHVHSSQALPIESINVDYLAEKIECIFGNSIQASPVALEEFVRLVKGGGIKVK
jgi:hypothetical protein